MQIGLLTNEIYLPLNAVNLKRVIHQKSKNVDTFFSSSRF
jgi:hypothetical protein